MMYAVVSTDRLETMLFVTDDKNEMADYLHLSRLGIESAIRRYLKNPNAVHYSKTMKNTRLVVIPEEDIDGMQQQTQDC